MTKTKAQLRAEAVERLRDCRYHTHADYVRAMLGWGHEPHFEDSRDALIDLLTDEEPRKFGVTAEQMAKASADFFDNLPSVNGKNGDFLPTTAEDEDANCKKADSLQDSREKLEADAYTRQGDVPPSKTDRVGDAQTAQGCADDEIIYGFQFCDVPSSTMLGETVFDSVGEPIGWIVANGLKGDFGHDADMSDSREKLEADILAWRGKPASIVDMIPVWLDRQAAITRAECDKPNWDYCETCDQFKAMQDRIDELEAALKGERNNFYQATEARKYWQRKYETVKAERDELKSKADALEADKASWQSGYHIDRISKLQAQRDRYRDLLSKAVDEAQAVVKLMEVDS